MAFHMSRESQRPDQSNMLDYGSLDWLLRVLHKLHFAIPVITHSQSGSSHGRSKTTMTIAPLDTSD
jgi:hypothetical protein